MENNNIRLNRFLSDSGFCSRREADRLIESQLVTVNDDTAILGQRVDPENDIIRVRGHVVESRNHEDYVYLALNKPRGITCTTDKRRKDNIIDFINYPTRIFHIGRLDRDSEGLILLTNDGSIVNKILRAQNRHEKEYFVEVDKPYDEDFVRQMENGVFILGQTTLPAKLKPISETTFRLIISQGLNRQIRRMSEALGYEVIYLQRRRIMNIDLGSLKLGEYRKLTFKEMRDLNELLKESKG